MPHVFRDDDQLLDLDTAVAAIDELTWEKSDRRDLIGIEIEALPVLAHHGSPNRLPLHGPWGAAGLVERYLPRLTPTDGSSVASPLVFTTPGGGRVTFEPGAQIELSSTAHSDAASLQSEISDDWDTIRAIFSERGAHLVCLGVDPFHDVIEVPQQQRAGRYIAMDCFFSAGWPAGAVMMRNTCSLQVNLEVGTGPIRDERWLAANMISPLLTAMFSTSPANGVASKRARIWQEIDGTRTGFPSWADARQVSSTDDVLVRALRANVMFVVRGGNVQVTELGWTFDEWIRYGHPEFGAPTYADLRTHLSTIFTEVRPRYGTLELRAIDSLPRRWWMVPIVVTGSILYDDQSRGQAIDLLSPTAGQLHRMWRTATDEGFRNPVLTELAEKLGQHALEGARRSDLFDRHSIHVSEAFLDRFTMRGRAPADELRPLLTCADDIFNWTLLESTEGDGS